MQKVSCEKIRVGHEMNVMKEREEKCEICS